MSLSSENGVLHERAADGRAAPRVTPGAEPSEFDVGWCGWGRNRSASR